MSATNDCEIVHLSGRLDPLWKESDLPMIGGRSIRKLWRQPLCPACSAVSDPAPLTRLLLHDGVGFSDGRERRAGANSP